MHDFLKLGFPLKTLDGSSVALTKFEKFSSVLRNILKGRPYRGIGAAGERKLHDDNMRSGLWNCAAMQCLPVILIQTFSL